LFYTTKWIYEIFFADDEWPLPFDVPEMPDIADLDIL